jgi:hypothetical protein
MTGQTARRSSRPSSDWKSGKDEDGMTGVEIKAALDGRLSSLPTRSSISR